MKKMMFGFVYAWGMALLLVDTCPAQVMAQKKLIGWCNEPNTAFMREHIAEMETSPFDGCVFHVDVKDPNRTIQFSWSFWTSRAFTEAELQPAIDDLKTTSFKRLTHNFLRVNITPGNVDWFDDFSSVLNNARLAAHVAREGKAAGIVFDTEQYKGNPFPFAYKQQRHASTKSFDEYAAQARLRGRELMQAFQEGYSDLHILLTYGYCLSLTEARYHRKRPGDPRYGLLAPLLDGMFDAATGLSKIIDGYEYSYGYKTAAEFDNARKQIHGADVFSVAKTNPAKTENHSSLAFGLWLDNGLRTNGWNTVDLEKNYFTPQSFEQSVRLALDHADEYVWIYTEKPRWWGTDGKPQDLPPAYDQALRKALKHEVPTASAVK